MRFLLFSAAGVLFCCASGDLVPSVAAAEGDFELLIVDAEGHGVPNATVEIRSTPKPQQQDILVGTFQKVGTYGTFAAADGDGRLAVRFSKSLRQCNFSIKHPEYGPYWAGNEVAAGLPDSFTAELEDGWSIGGVVVDEAGTPIEGVRVRPSIEFKKRPGDNSQLGVGTRITTDKQGRWRYDTVPASKNDVHLSFSHDRFMPLRRSLPRDDFFLALDDEPSEPIMLESGLSVSGIVADADGEPISDALVRAKFVNTEREARTDAAGRYELVGCEERLTEVVASADGFAVDMQRVRVSEDMEPVNFQLEPGGHVRIRVVDEQGKGIPKARIFFQDWRNGQAYFAFDHVDQYADENGVWEWNGAPLDEFTADICRPGGMQLSGRPIVARAEDYVFQPAPALVVSGKVTDAETGKPITSFRVTPGARWAGRENESHWHERNAFDAKGGQYEVRLTHDNPAFLVRIESLGYETATSRDIQTDEGQITIDFALKPATTNEVQVVTADGDPASGARVAMGAAGSQISVKNGSITDSSTYAKQFVTDEQGIFKYPAQPGRHQVVITHEAGFAKIDATSAPPSEVTLTPWARVEGQFFVGPEPGANVRLELSSSAIDTYGKETANIFTRQHATTASDGRFLFERAFPGTSRIGREIVMMVNEGATEVTSTVRIAHDLKAGKTHTTTLGGSGRAVSGRLIPPDDWTEKVDWKQLTVSARVNLPALARPQPPVAIQKNAEAVKRWRQEWLASEAGQRFLEAVEKQEAVRRNAPYATATIAADGSFRIHDMPAGNYLLSVWGSSGPRLRLDAFAVTVLPVDGGGLGKAVDAGEIRLSR